MNKFEIISKGRTDSDEYYTPDKVLYPLLKYVPENWVIWEPTARGSVNIVNFFEKHGYKCIPTFDDFLHYKEPIKGADVIITNPPYSKKTQFIEKSYSLKIPFCLLLPITALEGGRRQELYKKYGIQLILFDKRINFSITKKSPWFAVAWFCHEFNLPKDMMFESIGDEI